MQIENVESLPPSARRNRNRTYGPLIAAIVAANGKWVAVSLTDVSGPTRAHKRNVLIGAAERRGVMVETAVDDEKVYMRLAGVTEN